MQTAFILVLRSYVTPTTYTKWTTNLAQITSIHQDKPINLVCLGQKVKQKRNKPVFDGTIFIRVFLAPVCSNRISKPPDRGENSGR